MSEASHHRCSQTCGQLSLDVRASGDTTVLALHGELDLATTVAVRRALDDIDQNPPQRLIIDLSGLSFMDSCGVKLLVTESNRARRRSDLQLEIRPGPRSVQRVIEILGLDATLPFREE